MSASATRIVVAVDASLPSLAAAEAAAEIAESLGAELVGLFVEDIELLRLAALPLAVESDRLTASARACDLESIERQLRAQAARAREAFDRASAGRSLSTSFRVARGRTGAEILAAAANADLVALGCVGHGGGTERVGSTARAVAAGRGGRVVTLRRPPPRASWLDALAAELALAFSGEPADFAARLGEAIRRLAAPVLLVR